MRITVFNGSVHAERGNTHLLTESFAAGAREAGAEVEYVFLAKKKIKDCMACMHCWVKTPGKCVIKDDMAELLEMHMATDLVVFATPVYADNVTGIMKTFIDRLIPILDPHFEKDEHGETRHRKRYDKYPKVAVISSAGYPEQSHFQVVSHYFQRLARNAFTEVVAEIYRAGAILLGLGDGTPLQPIVDGYKALVKQAGREVVETGRLSEETWKKLEQPLVPHDLYLQEANKFWDKKIAAAAKGGE